MALSTLLLSVPWSCLMLEVIITCTVYVLYLYCSKVLSSLAVHVSMCSCKSSNSLLLSSTPSLPPTQPPTKLVGNLPSCLRVTSDYRNHFRAGVCGGRPQYLHPRLPARPAQEGTEEFLDGEQTRRQCHTVLCGTYCSD